jgi:uncharacterized RDD family membrane protein YckC
MKKARFGKRFLAFLIDALLSLGVFIFVYETILVSQWGGYTVGKKIVGIRVVSVQGEPIGWVEAFVRSISKILSHFLFLGFLWMLWDPESQTWHDKIADTYVVEA